MSVRRTLPVAVLLLGLLAPLPALAQDRATDFGGAADDDMLFVVEGGLVDLTPTPAELAAAGLTTPPAAAAASVVAGEPLAAYPNPAAGRATVRFTLDAAAPVRLAVYDLLGRQVAVLADGAFAAGPHEVAFDGSGLAGGLYVLRLQAGDAVHTQRLTLTR